jgi:penicillin-binding protein 2
MRDKEIKEIENFLDENFGFKLRLETKAKIFSFINILFFIVIFILLIYGAKLTILDFQKNRKISESHYYYTIPFFPQRGSIISSDNYTLSDNKIGFDLIIDLVILRSDEKIFKETIKFLEDIDILKEDGEITKEYLEEEMKKQSQIILRNIGEDKAILIKNRNLPTLIVIESYTRNYSYPYFSHVIGTLSNNKINGASGLEKIYDNFLLGDFGFKKYLRDARGKILKELEEKKPKPGYHLITTLNFKLQKIIYEEFENFSKEKDINKGAIIFMDKDGKILAFSSFPAFDNNLFSKFLSKKEDKEKLKNILQSKDSPLFNRATMGIYMPGSTIKPLLATAALELGKIKPEDKILSTGKISFKSPYSDKIYVFKDWKEGGHGWVNMQDAIRESVNTYFYILGERLGFENILIFFKKVLFDKISGIDLEEKAGYLPEKVEFLGDVLNLSIGQGKIGITPLRLILMMQALALNKIVKPFIVEKIIDEDGNVILERKPEIVLENIFKEENLEIVKKGMEMVVKDGFGRPLEKFHVAGKTGTPQAGESINGVFVGYFPRENPKYFFVVFLENSKNWSLSAIELSSKILDRAFKEGVFK